MQARTTGLWNLHRTLAAIALAAGLLGCRSDPYRDAYVEMLNAEKRVLEDRLYDVQYDYEQALAQLEAARRSSTGGREPPSRARAGEAERPLTEPDGDEPREALELPQIELPPGVEEGKRKRSGSSSAAVRSSPPVVTASAAKSRPLSEAELAAAIVSALDQRVEMISLNPRLTGGVDFDGAPGDDGIRVLIEPRNRSGVFVPEPAQISIVLLDPTQPDESARIARWNLDADAARESLQTDSLDRGLLFHLPWQGPIPDNKRLHMFVRYITADGRKLETDREINLESADMVAHRWTPRRIQEPEPMPDQEETAMNPARAEQGTTPEPTPDGETTVSWIPKDDGEKPTVAQAVAEEPVKTAPPPALPRSPGRFWKPNR